MSGRGLPTCKDMKGCSHYLLAPIRLLTPGSKGDRIRETTKNGLQLVLMLGRPRASPVWHGLQARVSWTVGIGPKLTGERRMVAKARGQRMGEREVKYPLSNGILRISIL